MEAPASYAVHQSTKRDFDEVSSSCMDDVVEISPPINWSSKSNSRSKRKEVAHQVIINIDPDDDPNGIILIDDECDFSYKSKQSASTSKATDFIQPSKNTDFEMANGFIGNGFSEHDFVYDDDYMYLFQDGSIFNDDYAFLQSKFDNIDTPTEIEVPVPWFTDPAENEKNLWFKDPAGTKKKSGSISGSYYPSSQAQLGASCIGSSHSGGKSFISPCSSSQQAQVAAKKPYGSGLSSSPNNNKLNAPPISQNLSPTMATGASSLSSRAPWNPLDLNILSASGYLPQINSYVEMSQPYNLTGTSIVKKKLTNNFSRSKLYDYLNGINESGNMGPYLSSEGALGVNGEVYPAANSSVPSGPTTGTKNHGNLDDIMKKFQQFKNFDTVEDYSDHHYSKNGSSEKQQPKAWGKKIQEEWRILEKDLPDTIFVRVYESRMDILRAVIVGAQGTPYHDGLFFFDVFFPSGYPSVPPKVHYHSGGLRINPNLYNCGKVCLSLLNTWTGKGNERWVPKKSTMLQVLVSIQALILNENPYFNEPGYASSVKSAAGQKSSKNYSENTFILSLKTMVYTMRKPPKQFEEFVIGHFCKHAQDILGACKVYLEHGAEVGSVTKGEFKNLQEKSKCSPHFQGNLKNYITMLVQAFVEIGAQDCDKFLSLAQMAGANSQLQSPYMPPGYQFFMPT